MERKPEVRPEALCPFLIRGTECACTADSAVLYRPTAFQEREYCTTTAYRSCPFFSISKSAGRTAAHEFFRGAR